jgi:hypothetical protein
MARKKRGDHVRTLTKVAGGKSLCVTLPIGLVREMNWESQMKVCVRKWGKRLILENAGELEEEGRECGK